MGRRGRKRQLDMETRYWELVLVSSEPPPLPGVSNFGSDRGFRSPARRATLAAVGAEMSPGAGRDGDELAHGR